MYMIGSMPLLTCLDSVNLSKIFLTASLQSEYHNLPTLGKYWLVALFCELINCSASEVPTDVDGLLSAFILRASRAIETGPYFEGYCGEHISEHPDVPQQLIGTSAFLGKRSPLNHGHGKHPDQCLVDDPLCEHAALDIGQPSTIRSLLSASAPHSSPRHSRRQTIPAQSTPICAMGTYTGPARTRIRRKRNVVPLQQSSSPAVAACGAEAGPSHSRTTGAISRDSDNTDPMPRAADLLTIPQVPELALFQRLLAGDGLHR
jgi:hypothetical protein